jgi:hypothetical protein
MRLRADKADSAIRNQSSTALIGRCDRGVHVRLSNRIQHWDRFRKPPNSINVVTVCGALKCANSPSSALGRVASSARVLLATLSYTRGIVKSREHLRRCRIEMLT